MGIGVGARPGGARLVVSACVSAPDARRRGVCAAGHPIHWHVDPDIRQEIAHYNARRRKNLAGWGAIDSLAGEGYKVAARKRDGAAAPPLAPCPPNPARRLHGPLPPQPDARPPTCLAPYPTRGSVLCR